MTAILCLTLPFSIESLCNQSSTIVFMRTGEHFAGRLYWLRLTKSLVWEWTFQFAGYALIDVITQNGASCMQPHSMNTITKVSWQ